MRGVYLGLGSNLGDREANLAAARKALDEGGAHILAASQVRETAPFGVPDQPHFLNQAVEVDWSEGPFELLELAKAIERRLGRTPSYRWGPRLIDVDILIFGDIVLDTPELSIPHQGLGQRRFVLEPLDEVAPELFDPRTQVRISDLLRRILET